MYCEVHYEHIIHTTYIHSGSQKSFATRTPIHVYVRRKVRRKRRKPLHVGEVCAKHSARSEGLRGRARIRGWRKKILGWCESAICTLLHQRYHHRLTQESTPSLGGLALHMSPPSLPTPSHPHPTTHPH